MSNRYTLGQRLIHWLMAIMILGTLAVGMIFAILEFKGTLETFGKDTTNLLYKYHKTFGILIGALIILRIALKLATPRPEYDPPLKRFDRIASASLHGFFYVALVVMPITGWLATGASGFPVEFFNWNLPAILSKDKDLGALLYEIHGVFGWLLLIGAIVHIGAAVKHWLIDRDGVMGRMGF